MSSHEEIATAFVKHFYSTFDTNVEGLAGLYSPQSMLTFEGNQVCGKDNIVEKLRSIGVVKHEPKSMDVQPSSNPNALLIFVTGNIKIGGGNPLHFCEMFQLLSTSSGSYYLHNDIFRLNYGM